MSGEVSPSELARQVADSIELGFDVDDLIEEKQMTFEEFCLEIEEVLAEVELPWDAKIENNMVELRHLAQNAYSWAADRLVPFAKERLAREFDEADTLEDLLLGATQQE